MPLNQNKTIKVLLIEDNKLIQKIHLAMLEKLNCWVDLVENSYQIIEKIGNNYDIIFTDLDLPCMQDDQIIISIRSNGIHQPVVPIIVLTTHYEEAIKIRCLQAGAQSFFTKPVSMETIKKILRINRLL